MKKKDELADVGGSIVIVVGFGILAILSAANDAPAEIMWVPCLGVFVGIIFTIIAAVKSSNANARKEQQESFAKTLVHDSSFGDGDLKMYFDSNSKKVTICATTTNGSTQQTVDDFVKSKSVQTDYHLVALDSTQNKVLRAKNNKGSISLGQCCINDEMKSLGVDVKNSSPSLKAYNDYAFITDDVNQFVAIVTPTKIHVHKYSDIVSISYQENGSNVYNKSIGGAVVGGLLFGGVGAIVGGNTAKATQNKEIKTMSIKILLNSTSNSNIILSIYKVDVENAALQTKKDVDRLHYEDLMKEVSGIKDIFSIILDIADKNIALQKSAPIIQHNSNSVADELSKLAKLKDSGILTDEEFTAQKAKLLNQ